MRGWRSPSRSHEQVLDLDHRPVGKGGVEDGRVEAGQPVPQGEVGRRRRLRLQGDDAPDGLGHVQRFAAREQLPAERGPVEPPGGDAHGSDVRVGASAVESAGTVSAGPR